MDCDFSRGLLQIRDPKSGVNRVAYMTPRVRAVLESRKARNDNGNGGRNGDGNCHGKSNGHVSADGNGNPVQATSKAFKKAVSQDTVDASSQKLLSYWASS